MILRNIKCLPELLRRKSSVAFEERQPEVWVDTHVHRVAKRLGLIGPKVNADQAHEIFAQIVPAAVGLSPACHLIRHGRQICHAQRPACPLPSVQSMCLRGKCERSRNGYLMPVTISLRK